MLCRLPPPAPPCRLDAREPEAEPEGGGASSNKRSRRDGICFFIAEKRLITEGEGAPIIPPPAAAAAGASSLRLGERAEDTDPERTEDVADRDRDGLDGVGAAAGAGAAADDDDSNRLPRVDLSEDAMMDVADEASFALSFSCGVAGVRKSLIVRVLIETTHWKHGKRSHGKCNPWCRQSKELGRG